MKNEAGCLSKRSSWVDVALSGERLANRRLPRPSITVYLLLCFAEIVSTILSNSTHHKSTLANRLYRKYSALPVLFFQFGNIHSQRMKQVRGRYLCLLSFTYPTSCLNNNNNSLSIEFCENLSGNYTTKTWLLYDYSNTNAWLLYDVCLTWVWLIYQWCIQMLDYLETTIVRNLSKKRHLVKHP